MKFLLDESADYPLASFLISLGHDIKTIVDDYSFALEDREVLSLAQKEQRILITNDRDFGELIFRYHLPHTGVILLRLGNESLDTKKSLLEKVLIDYKEYLSEFIVVTEHTIRIRKTSAVN